MQVSKLIRIPGPVIVFGDHTCELKFVGFDFVAGADGVKILRPIEIDERYFYRVAQTFDVRGNGYSRHYKFFVNNLFPLPPRTEQERIASRIDELMGLCDDLEAHQRAKWESRVRLNTAILAPLNKAASLTPDEYEQATTHLADNFNTLLRFCRYRWQTPLNNPTRGARETRPPRPKRRAFVEDFGRRISADRFTCGLEVVSSSGSRNNPDGHNARYF